ncbi:monocarboxylate transporter [Scheffersomyces xylosifermentans]|uniref:monocarboxylate transporter n=1 Tax=Scheffersomyces xylosifermentans TaxID=1304137 RepID=UPI00315DEC97
MSGTNETKEFGSTSTISQPSSVNVESEGHHRGALETLTSTHKEKELQVDLEKLSKHSSGKESHTEVEDPDINGGYAFVILACAVFLNFCSWGNNSGFAIYFAYYNTNNVYPNATKMDFAAIGGICFGAGVACGPIVNYINGLIGMKKTLMIGNILQFTALLLSSFDSRNRLWELYLTQGLLQSFGLVFIGLPTFTVLPHWFKNSPLENGKYRIKDRMLTLSQGIATGGTGLGGLVFNLGMQKVLQNHGVRWALRTQSFISLFVCSVAILLLKEKKRNVKVEFTIFDLEVFLMPGMWFLVAYVVFGMLGYVVLLYSLSNWTIALGYSAHDGSIVAAMTSVGILIGRPIIGLLSDRYGAVIVSSISYLLISIFSFAMWIPSRTFAQAIIFSFINGLLSGTLFPTIGTITLLAIGGRFSKLNVTFCMFFIFFGLTGIASPIVGIALKKPVLGPTQFEYCSALVGATFFVTGIVLLFMRGYIISVMELEAPEMTDSEFFAIRPRLTRCIRNTFRIRYSEYI